MSRYHVCVKKQALHFGTDRLEEAFELATYLHRQGRKVAIIDNVTGCDVELPKSSETKRIKKVASA